MSNQWCDTCGGLVDRIGLRPQGVRFCGCRTTIEKLRAELATAREWGSKLAEAENCIQALEKDLAAERERANYAWKNTRLIDADRQRVTGERDTLRAENSNLREALKWYAEPVERGQYRVVTSDGSYLSDFADWGGKARAALNGTES